jgi:hypothetical protein
LIKEFFSCASGITSSRLLQRPGNLLRQRCHVAFQSLLCLSDFHLIPFYFRQPLHGRGVLFGLRQEPITFLQGYPRASASQEAANA